MKNITYLKPPFRGRGATSPFRGSGGCYASTLSYLYSRLPMFTRIGTSAYKADLTNTIEICKILGNPHKTFKSIHIGGTNGKGSTSHMLAAILQTAGYKTGLYTSPHLRDFRERIRVNGEMISETKVIEFVKSFKPELERIEPSFFEATVGMAFQHFAQEEVDIAVVEVGLGGRLDSTNIIDPILSVITNISYDHMDILGNTLPEIALEKAGIIKDKTPIIIGELQNGISNVFLKKAKEKESTIIFASEEWEVVECSKLKVESNEYLNLDVNQLPVESSKLKVESDEYLNLESTNPLIHVQLDLTGSYQKKNLTTVLSAVLELRKQGFTITDEHIKSALKQVKNLTGLLGRWQILNKSPLVICDTGHNEDGIKEVLKNIGAITYENLHFVIGMVKEKEISNILNLLPKNATYYFCEPKIPRAKPAIELAIEANALGLKGQSYLSVKNALRAALAKANIKDLVFVGGSTFVVAEVI